MLHLYAKAPAYKPAPQVPPPILYAIWGQTFGDQELRSEMFNGTDVGRLTTTYGGIGGFDATFNNALFGGTWVLGILGGDTVSKCKK